VQRFPAPSRYLFDTLYFHSNQQIAALSLESEALQYVRWSTMIVFSLCSNSFPLTSPTPADIRKREHPRQGKKCTNCTKPDLAQRLSLDAATPCLEMMGLAQRLYNT
jgi:hypothetical protein